MIAREANWRCCAMESATNFSAATFSSSLVRMEVVRGGMSASGSEAGGGRLLEEDMVAREEEGSGRRV